MFRVVRNIPAEVSVAPRFCSGLIGTEPLTKNHGEAPSLRPRQNDASRTLGWFRTEGSEVC